MSAGQYATRHVGLHIPLQAVALSVAFAFGVVAGVGLPTLVSHEGAGQPSGLPAPAGLGVPDNNMSDAANQSLREARIRVIDFGPVRGEFRLGPGNTEPPRVVVPSAFPVSAPVPGEFRLGPGNTQPPRVVVPLT